MVKTAVPETILIGSYETYIFAYASITSILWLTRCSQIHLLTYGGSYDLGYVLLMIASFMSITQTPLINEMNLLSAMSTCHNYK